MGMKHNDPPKSKIKAMRPDGGIKKIPHAHEVDPMLAAIIERCRSAGMTAKQAAEISGVSENTINNHYREDWNRGTATIVAGMANNMAVIAMDPNHKQAVNAAKFMLSRLAPEVFSERRQIQMLDAAGQPTNAVKTLDPYQMSDEQRELLKETLADVLKEAVDEANARREGELPEAQYTAIEDGRNVADYEEE